MARKEKAAVCWHVKFGDHGTRFHAPIRIGVRQ
jgi:hypothetical protein